MRELAARRFIASALVAGAVGVPALAGVSASGAFAQALTPMRGEVSSFTGEFALRVVARNPSQHPMGIEMRAYDHRFRPIPARFTRDRFMLGGKAVRRVTALIPFNGERVRYVRVCAEAVPLRSATQSIRTRVCGKFRAQRR